MKTLCSERIFLIMEIGLILLVGGLAWLILTNATGKFQRFRYLPAGIGAVLLLVVYVVTSTGMGRRVCKGEWEKNDN